MTADLPDAQRCRWQTTNAGHTVQCGEPGGWVLDEKNKTWRPAGAADRRRRCWHHGPGASRRPAGRNRGVDRPNVRLKRLEGLLGPLANEVTIALREVSEELSMLGFPSKGGGGSSSGDDDGPVARDAIRIAELTDLREDLRDRLHDEYIDEWLSDLIQTISRIRRRPPAAMRDHLCAEHQQGRQGSIEWGDPLCTDLPVRDGLCAPCWQREYRWRRTHGLPTSEHPAA